ncbi:Isochorismatase hydrolase [Rhizodiscina lignyota]|uniref:Isochorismatase hydrolase n=1 Tax=Rhizodiscina lignyota TaxID=1504668 RepID=A0A9P4IAJ2_9PEZI|nr:Isochorismatase hydrolase [Rhizodiscina lignyota]
MAKTALFVIDIQDELALDPQTRIPDASRICDAGTALLDRARSYIDKGRSNGAPSDLEIVFVQHEETDGTLIKGSKPWELVFKPREEDDHEMLVGKQTQDTFESNPELASQLKQSGVKRIVTFGIQSDCCVQATSKGALGAGFDVTVLSGAHSTYDTEEKKAVEIERDIDEELQEKGANLLPWEQWYP